jgi:hypothetical protein
VAFTPCASSDRMEAPHSVCCYATKLVCTKSTHSHSHSASHFPTLFHPLHSLIFRGCHRLPSLHLLSGYYGLRVRYGLPSLPLMLSLRQSSPSYPAAPDLILLLILFLLLLLILPPCLFSPPILCKTTSSPL